MIFFFRYKQRFLFAASFFALNMANAIYAAITKLLNPRKNVTHVVLLILAGNLFLYIVYYVWRKNLKRCQGMGLNCCGDKMGGQKGDTDQDQVDANLAKYAKYHFEVCGVKARQKLHMRCSYLSITHPLHRFQ